MTGGAADTRAAAELSQPGRIARGVRWASERELWLQLALLLFMLCWYGAALQFSVHLSNRVLDLTFNSMLDHLLHGRVDVDPRIVGVEGFLRNGRTLSYFGIWCALVRLPLWLLHRMDKDVTVWSCLAAVCLSAMAKVRAVLLVRRQGIQDRVVRHASELLLAYILLGGSEIAYLRVSIYQEVVFWSVAFASVFVYFAIKGLVNQRFDLITLSAMALCAGLALLTRVSTAIGLVLALGLLLLALAARKASIQSRFSIAKCARALFDRRVVVPVAILAVFMLATGAINYLRWGNPLTFADFRLQIVAVKLHPDRIPRAATYGLFNLQRIPLALIYYFFPIWAVVTRHGTFLFEQVQVRLFDGAELPASSFLLTDLLPVCFIGLFLIACRKQYRRSLPAIEQWVAVAAGLAAPCLMMLTAIYMAFRYRMEFYPEMDFLALLGLYAMAMDDRLRSIYTRRRIWFEAALLVSIITSTAVLFLYWLGPLGPAREFLQSGVLYVKYMAWY